MTAITTGLVSIGRDGVIRTLDPLHPMQVRYQAALRPDELAIITEGAGILLSAAGEIFRVCVCEMDFWSHNGSFFIFPKACPDVAGRLLAAFPDKESLCR